RRDESPVAGTASPALTKLTLDPRRSQALCSTGVRNSQLDNPILPRRAGNAMRQDRRSASRRSTRSGAQLLAAAMYSIACGVIGCGPSDEDVFRQFVPDEPAARSALELALSAYKQGRPIEPIIDGERTVEVFDTSRDAARPLRDYRILGAIGDQ